MMMDKFDDGHPAKRGEVVWRTLLGDHSTKMEPKVGFILTVFLSEPELLTEVCQLLGPAVSQCSTHNQTDASTDSSLNLCHNTTKGMQPQPKCSSEVGRSV
jgi:hypothetical protein